MNQSDGASKRRGAMLYKRALSVFIFCVMAVSALAREAVVTVKADRLNCRYEAGETALLKVSVQDEAGRPLRTGRVAYVLDDFGPTTNVERIVDLVQTNTFSVSMRRDRPGFARLRVRSLSPDFKVRKNGGNGGDGYVFGVAFSPARIVSGTPDPEDFDAFWRDAAARLAATVPLDARIEPMPQAGTRTMNAFRVSFATAGDRRVYGWLTEPKDLSRGPFPVRVRVPGAGIGFTRPLFSEGEVCLAMNVHSYPQPEGDGKKADDARSQRYKEQDAAFAKPLGVKRYCQAGIHLGRENYFYYASILGISRAVDWLAARPECNRRDITYSGTSQGGGFGLYLTALNRHITRSCIFVPALTDLLGFKVEGRQSGWPQLVEAQKPENRAAAERWAPYFCGVNFARRITCPIRFVAGFSDTVCTPNGVYSAFNACPSKDKRIYDGVGMGHGVFGDYYGYLDAWERDGARKPSAYRFMAFNIWGDYFGNPPHERDAHEAALVRTWNPDFVAFQEVTANFWKSRLIANLEGDYAVIGRGMGPDGIDAFTPLAYRRNRFTLVDSGSEWFCCEIDTSKGVVWAVLRDKASGKRLAVFASHFWWQSKGVGDNWIRLDNAKRLLATMQAVAKRHDAAIVGGGDLNASSDSWAMKYLSSNGLADAQLKACVSPRTFQTDHGNPRRDAKGVYVGVPAVRGMTECFATLDHVFYDPTRISAARFDLDISAEACALSDHHPIVVDFDLKR